MSSWIFKSYITENSFNQEDRITSSQPDNQNGLVEKFGYDEKSRAISETPFIKDRILGTLIPKFRLCPNCGHFCENVQRVKVSTCECGIQFCFNCLKINDKECSFYHCRTKRKKKRRSTSSAPSLKLPPISQKSRSIFVKEKKKRRVSSFLERQKKRKREVQISSYPHDDPTCYVYQFNGKEQENKITAKKIKGFFSDEEIRRKKKKNCTTHDQKLNLFEQVKDPIGAQEVERDGEDGSSGYAKRRKYRTGAWINNRRKEFLMGQRSRKFRKEYY